MPPEIPGYHHHQSPDGAFTLEMDTPCEGAVTLTWEPDEYPGKSSKMEMPLDNFLQVVVSFSRERKASRTKETAPA